jgi:hypothetical protein
MPSKLVSDEMIEQARKGLEEQNRRITAGEPERTDWSSPRTKGQGAAVKAREPVANKNMPTPPELNPDEFGPCAFAAVIVPPITGDYETQAFSLDGDKVQYLHFTPPGANLPKKRLYTVKAFHRDGRLVQLGFEPQIQNNAGGDPEDAIGLRRYQRKGMILLFDFTTMQPVYCAAWGCWAQADGVTGFCSTKHAQHTLPNRFKEAGAMLQGLFDQGVTTSRVWDANR